MPKEEKSTNFEYEEHIYIVEEMLLSGLKRKEIIKNIKEIESLQWDISDRQVDNYIKDATININKKLTTERKDIANQLYAKYDFLYKKMINANDIRGAVVVLDKISDLTGAKGLI